MKHPGPRGAARPGPGPRSSPAARSCRRRRPGYDGRVAEAALDLVVAKLLLAPALVGLAALAGRRWGPRAAGLASALPIVAGPILLFYALEQGPAFASSAASGALVGLVPLTVFCLAHATLARAAVRLPRCWSAPLCLAGGWAAFLAAAAALHPLPVPAWLAPPVGAAALGAGLALVRDPPADGRAAARHHPALEAGLRMAAAALLLTALTGLAARLGPAWSGLLTPFPVASSVLLAFGHLADGPACLGAAVRGFLLGLFGFVAFLAVLSFTLVPLGLGAAFALGLGAGLPVAAVVAAAPWPTPARPGGAR